jgi:hypothetical protein
MQDHQRVGCATECYSEALCNELRFTDAYVIWLAHRMILHTPMHRPFATFQAYHKFLSIIRPRRYISMEPNCDELAMIRAKYILGFLIHLLRKCKKWSNPEQSTLIP